MPVVTGTIKDEAESVFVGPVIFENLDAPSSGGSFVVGPAETTINTESDGTLPTGTHLAPGRTRFKVNGRWSRTFTIPEDGPYDLSLLMAIPAAFDADSIEARLVEITEAEGYQLSTITYDDDGVVETATVLWPDGSAGVYTTTTKNATFLTVDAFTITHSNSSKTVTQSAVTRDSSGRVTVKPALTVS